jgi:predicted RNase H-like HicB family nuclease
MSDDRRYPKQVFWSEEDEGFIAIAPDLSGCSAFGGTESDALSELDQAIEVWIAAAKQAGNPIPAPGKPGFFRREKRARAL